MIAKSNRSSLQHGASGLLLQLLGPVAAYYLVPSVPQLPGLSVWLGTMLLLTCFAYYAMGKGRSKWWCLLGFFSIFEYLVLARLEDRSEASK